MFRNKSLIAFLAVAATLAFVAVEAMAAPRMNAGSRGNRTQMAPPATQTSPNTARPIDRTMTTPSTPGAATAARPGTPAAAAPGGFFSRGGLLGGLAAGFLGAGLIGMLMGGGFLSGMAGFASFLGLLLQVGLIALLGFLAYRWWQRRSQPQQQPAYANAGMDRGMNRDTNPGMQPQQSQGGLLGGFGLNGGHAGNGHAGNGHAVNVANDLGQPIEVTPQDFDAFERTLTGVQKAYSDEDLAELRKVMTPEMLSYFAEELAANQSRGVINKITDVKLVQGDLAEAWREGDDEYATVAMRYSQVDRLLDRNTGKVLEGSDTPDEGVEVWTFRRANNGPWLVSAIQQTD